MPEDGLSTGQNMYKTCVKTQSESK